MSRQAEDVLLKINFIEADMEIQRQILMSLPSDNKKEIQEAVETLARQKQQIQELRKELQQADPVEYQRVVTFERAADTFKELVRSKSNLALTSRGENGQCAITLSDNTTLECLVTAREENGNWIVFTLEGLVRQFTRDEVRGNPG